MTRKGTNITSTVLQQTAILSCVSVPPPPLLFLPLSLSNLLQLTRSILLLLLFKHAYINQGNGGLGHIIISLLSSSSSFIVPRSNGCKTAQRLRHLVFKTTGEEVRRPLPDPELFLKKGKLIPVPTETNFSLSHTHTSSLTSPCL